STGPRGPDREGSHGPRHVSADAQRAAPRMQPDVEPLPGRRLRGAQERESADDAQVDRSGAVRPSHTRRTDDTPTARRRRAVERPVETALMSLKSIGLLRFVHPSPGGRTIRYRHAADERWRLERNELAVLAVLVLRGPQTAGEIKSRAERQLDPAGPSVDEAL